MNEFGALINYMLAISIELQRVGVVVQAMQSEGRTSLKTEERSAIRQDRTDAFENLDAAILRAEAEGR